jgi:putative transcriptional regulator
MTEEEIYAAALSDPDAQPLTEADLARMKRVSRAKTIRRVLQLTQEEFAARYHIPLGTLRDWKGALNLTRQHKRISKLLPPRSEAIYQALQAVPH